MNADSLPSPTTTLDTAAEWFARKRSSVMTAQELCELQAWLDEEPAHAEAFRLVMATWDASAAVATDPDMLTLREAARGRRPRRQIWIWSGFAGICAAGLLASFWFAYDAGYFAPVWEGNYRTAIGQITTVTLRDGSVANLDTDSELRVRFSGRERRVELLRGQALFHVAKDRQKPFVVIAADHSVTATGTKFDVRIDRDRFDVTLLEGRVHVETVTGSNPGEAADLLPGWEFSDVNDDVRIMRVNSDTAGRRMAWLQGRIAVAGEPLSSVIAELNRYSVRKIVLMPAVADERIDGVFHAGDIDGFVNLARRDRLVRVVSDTGAEVVLDSAKKRDRKHT